MGHHKKGSQDELVSGAAFTILFSILYFRVGGWFWIFPLIFAGFFPLARGLTAYIQRRQESPRLKENPKEAKSKKEKEILRLAKSKGGILTVAGASLESSLSLEEAERILSDLSDRGYARMEVEDDGAISYRFPDFQAKRTLEN